MTTSDFGNVAGYAGCASFIALMMVIGWIAFRARSWHLVRYRLWLFAQGKKAIKDEQIQTFIDDESDLASFRFFLLDADNIHEARDLMNWATAAKVQLNEARACGPYFLRSRKALVDKLPSRRFVWGFFAVGTWILGMAFAAVLTAAASSTAILRFKQSGQWFLLSNSTAKVLFHSDATALREAQCVPSTTVDAKTYFNADDTASICKSFQDKTLASYIESSVKSQRWASGTLAAGLLFLFVLMWRNMRHVEASWRLSRRLK